MIKMDLSDNSQGSEDENYGGEIIISFKYIIYKIRKAKM